MNNIEIFRRVEQKYLLSNEQYNTLMLRIKDHLHEDIYFESKILNIYFDTPTYDLIVNSLEKGIYKEKVRLRSYKVPNLLDTVFLEIKSKYEGVVYKRRITLTLQDYYNYLKGIKANYSNPQIMKEIDYIFKKYNLVPKYFIGYDRKSYYDKENKYFRITFDENIRSRSKNLKLELGDEGQNLFEDNMIVMELKNLGGIPLWFTKILSELKIYPTSFSKYGNIYKKDYFKEEVYV